LNRASILKNLLVCEANVFSKNFPIIFCETKEKKLRNAGEFKSHSFSAAGFSE